MSGPSPLQLGNRSPKLRVLKKDAGRDAASAPVTHALDGAWLTCDPENFGNSLGPAEQFDDVGVKFHSNIKHHVYTQVNTACNP